MTIRPLTAADLPAASDLLDAALGGRLQARRGELVDVLEGRQGLVAVERTGDLVGILTWFSTGTEADAELRAVAVAATARGRGVGRALLDAAADGLRGAGIRRAWLVTTNDNLAALALYQKAGWRLTTLRPGAIDAVRYTLKPSIPEVGEHGIPLRDELELEVSLDA